CACWPRAIQLAGAGVTVICTMTRLTIAYGDGEVPVWRVLLPEGPFQIPRTTTLFWIRRVLLSELSTRTLRLKAWRERSFSWEIPPGASFVLSLERSVSRMPRANHLQFPFG